MTEPRPEVLEREKDKLFLTDAELFRRLGVPRAVLKPIITTLENWQSLKRVRARNYNDE